MTERKTTSDETSIDVRICSRCGTGTPTPAGLMHSPNGEAFCQQCLDNHHGRY